MSALLIGYARVSTDQQDLTAQRDGLAALGVGDDRVYVDHGLTGANRDRPGLRQALAACRAGDTLVVTKLDRLARSLPDAREILEDLTRREVKLSIGASVHDPTDPVGRLLFNVLAMVAEFEADLIRLRTREHAGCQGQGPFAREAAQAQPATGGAPRHAVPRGRAQRVRARGPLRHHPLDRVPRGAARHATTARWRDRAQRELRAPVDDRACGTGRIAGTDSLARTASSGAQVRQPSIRAVEHRARFIEGVTARGAISSL